MAPVRALSVLLGAFGAHASDESVLLQTSSLVGVVSKLVQSPDIYDIYGTANKDFGTLMSNAFGEDSIATKSMKHLQDLQTPKGAALNPVRIAFNHEIAELQREAEIEQERRKSLSEEIVKSLPRVSNTDISIMKSLDSVINGTRNIDSLERQNYFRERLQKYSRKLRGPPENVSYFIAQDGESCREGPTIYMERVLYQIGKYPKKFPALQFAVDPSGLRPGTCASANYTLASEWSGCFPAARAWVREGTTDLDLEDSGASWVEAGGTKKSWKQQVEALCFNIHV